MILFHFIYVGVLLSLFLWWFIILHIKLLFHSHDDATKFCCTPHASEKNLSLDQATIKSRRSAFYEINIDDNSNFTEFIRKHYPEIIKSTHVKIHQFNSAIVFKISGKIASNPYLISIDLDLGLLLVNSVKVMKEQPSDEFFTSSDLFTVILESLSLFLKDHQTPHRTFYIMFLKDSQDDDKLAKHLNGSSMALRYFRSEKHFEKFEFILENPGVVLNNSLLGVNHIVGVVGVTRKGYIRISFKRDVSYEDLSSMPFFSFLHAFSSKQINMYGSGYEITMLEILARMASYPYNLIYHNLWFFNPLLSHYMSKNFYWSTVTKTKTFLLKIYFIQMDIVGAVIKQLVHYKLDVNQIWEFSQKILKKPSNRFQLLDKYQPLKTEYPFKTETFTMIKRSFEATFANSIILPGDSISNSHLRDYESMAKLIYQFSPFIADKSKTKSKGKESALENYYKSIKFYYFLFVNSDNSK